MQYNSFYLNLQFSEDRFKHPFEKKKGNPQCYIGCKYVNASFIYGNAHIIFLSSSRAHLHISYYYSGNVSKIFLYTFKIHSTKVHFGSKHTQDVVKTTLPYFFFAFWNNIRQFVVEVLKQTPWPTLPYWIVIPSSSRHIALTSCSRFISSVEPIVSSRNCKRRKASQRALENRCHIRRLVCWPNQHFKGRKCHCIRTLSNHFALTNIIYALSILF